MPSINDFKSLRILTVATVGLCALSLTAVAAEQEGAMDHSKMDHSQHDMSTERDAEGRTLYTMKHKMEPALTKELREKIALYKNYTDAEITLSMDMMGPEYAWYISPPDLKGSQGVLILMHGFREQGDKMFRNQVQSIGDIFPTSMGVGMAMMMSEHIQIALNDLEAAGAKEIAVVPITSSATNELHRQWMYVFGKQEKAEFATIPRVKSGAKLLFVDPPGSDPLVAEILLDHALELSQDPKKEIVFIAGHGPSGAEDNAEELRVLSGLAKVVKQDGGFVDVQGMTLQDDAPPEIREANVKKLREAIEAAAKNGQRVLVVTNLISGRSVQAKLRSDLKGLNFEFNSKGLVNHPNFMKWMGEAIRHQFESN
ncbi:MAG: hypothetical protein Q8N51_16450 [Gammaproteobacteria bacterium]|nr:hypothetical protein [Gammaproteobacteria bacterium]